MRNRNAEGWHWLSACSLKGNGLHDSGLREKAFKNNGLGSSYRGVHATFQARRICAVADNL